MANLELYIGCDCVSEHRKFDCAKKAFNKAVKKYPDMDIDIIFEGGAIYSWDADSQTEYDYRY